VKLWTLLPNKQIFGGNVSELIRTRTTFKLNVIGAVLRHCYQCSGWLCVLSLMFTTYTVTELYCVECNRLNVHEIKHVHVVNGSSLSVDSLGTTHVGWDVMPCRVLAEDTSNHTFKQMMCDDVWGASPTLYIQCEAVDVNPPFHEWTADVTARPVS